MYQEAWFLQIAEWKSVRYRPPYASIGLGSLPLSVNHGAVRAQGSFIYLWLWVLGRVADGYVLRKAGDFSVVGPSVGHEMPQTLTG